MLKSIYQKSEVKPVYFNIPQLKSMLVSAPEEYAIWGRGTGKSEGVLAPRMYHWMKSMPKSSIVLVGATYQQTLTRTLPGIIRGWERMGFVRDRDYFVGKYAPTKWGWDKPYLAPIKSEYLIHNRFGGVIHLVSQDRQGSSNGISIDCIAGDEAKFLRQDRYEQELLPAMRGNRHVFGHLDCWNNILLTTDMPAFKSGRWLLEKEKLMDQERVQLILAAQMKISKLHQRIQTDNSGVSLKRLYTEVRKYQILISKLRMPNKSTGHGSLVYYSEASSYENIDVLGEEYFEKQRRNMTPFNFDTSIKNIRPKKDQHSFYPDLDETKHGYSKFDNSYLDSLNYDIEAAENVDCRQDGDLMNDEPLYMGFDYGASFNCVLIGQLLGSGSINAVKGMHVNYPQKIKDLIADIKRYYSPHKRKHIIYFYDHTAIGEEGKTDTTYMDEVIDAFRKDDQYGSWAVEAVYIGHTPSPDDRYKMWSNLLIGDLGVQFRYNRNNCEDWETSCMNAPVIQAGNKMKKDKSSEKKKPGKREYVVPQEEATHYSDAGDTLVNGMLSRMNRTNQGISL